MHMGDSMNCNVLILDGYARQTLAMAKAFREIGCEVTVAYFSRLDVGFASRYPHHKVRFACARDDYDRQYELAHKLICSDKYDLVVPMTDYSAIYLAIHKDELKKHARIAVNDADTFELAINKSRTMEVCKRLGISAPATVFAQKLTRQIVEEKLEYPVVIKPVTACGSIGFQIISDRAHLESYLAEYDDQNGPLMAQEYVPAGGKQYNIQMFIDRDGVRKMGIASQKCRWFPLDGGAATCVMTIENEGLLQQCEALLKGIGWEGYADLDIIEHKNKQKLMVIEINPRISANVKLCFASGVDVAKLIYENEFEQRVTDQTTYSLGKSMRCTLTEILWFLKAKDRFKSKPSWFSLGNSCDVVFSWKDPLPGITFCLQSALNYRHAMRQRRRK
jgi:D-aspartate ligase